MKTIHVKAVVVYPIYIDQEIEVEDNATPDQIEEEVLNLADDYLEQGSSEPVFQEEVEITEPK